MAHDDSSGDVLTNIYQYLLRISERGLNLPIAAAEAVTYEHHFPRAWYYLEPRGNGNGASRSSHDAPSHTEGSSPSAVGEGTGIFTDVPYVMKKRPPRQCGSKAICSAFTGVETQAEQHVDQSHNHHHRRKATQVVATVVQRPPSHDPSSAAAGGGATAPADVVVTHLEVSGLQAITISAPETCTLTKYLPPDRGHERNDAVYITFTPTMVSIERRINKHRYDDLSVPAPARACTSNPDFSETAACSPLLAQATRLALHRLAWFIEATEARKVLELRAVVKPRRGVLWLVWAERLILSPHPLDLEKHTLRFGAAATAAQQHQSGSSPSASPTLSAEEDAQQKARIQSVSWDAIEVELDQRQLRIEQNRRATKLTPLSMDAIDKAKKRVKAPYGAWPSFCQLPSIPPDVVIAVDRRFAELQAAGVGVVRPSSRGPRGGGASTPVVMPPASLMPASRGYGGDSNAVMGAAVEWAQNASAAQPLTLSCDEELDGFWASFDTALSATVDAAVLDAKRSAARTERLSSATSGLDLRRTSISSLHSSRSVATRSPNSRPSFAIVEARRSQRLEKDISAHIEDLDTEFNAQPSASWGYGMSPKAAARSQPQQMSFTTTAKSGRRGTRGDATTTTAVAAGRSDQTPSPQKDARTPQSKKAPSVPSAAQAAVLDMIYAAYEASVAGIRQAGDAGPGPATNAWRCSGVLSAEAAADTRTAIASLQEVRGAVAPFRLVATGDGGDGDGVTLLCDSLDASAGVRHLTRLLDHFPLRQPLRGEPL